MDEEVKLWEKERKLWPVMEQRISVAGENICG